VSPMRRRYSRALRTKTCTLLWRPCMVLQAQIDRMSSRREFITLIGGAAATWPLAGRAQQGERMRRIGVLMTTAADDAEGQARIAAFLQGLQQSGWTVGGNVRIDIRYGADNAATRKHAGDLASLAPDVILANGSAAVASLLQASHCAPSGLAC